MIQSSKQVPFFTSSHQTERYGAQISERINAIIRKGSFILGDEVKLLEDQLSRFTGIKHAIGVANGSDALYLCLNALDLPEGSEVITTPFTFFASVSCITRNRLVPKFVDVNKDTCNIAPDRIESKITGKTAAILPVDLFCQTADMEPVRRLADKYNLKLIEDSAEAFGMKYQNQHAGKLADLSVLSFFPTKTLSCYGDGGMVLTDNDELAVKIRKLRSHGASKKYYHEYVGINSRLDELQAGILNIKMKWIEEEIRERAAIAKAYFERLAGIPQIRLPSVISQADPVWYVFSIQAQNRDELKNHLETSGIGVSVYYPQPIHLQECYRYLGYKAEDFPNALYLSQTSLALPVYIGMTMDDIDRVCEAIRTYYQGKNPN